MARVNRVNKSRKEKVCGGCGRVIPVGSPYQFVDFYSGRTAIRCDACGFKPYETTENPYYQELYRIQYEYAKKLDYMDATNIDSTVKDDIVSDLESLRDEVQERFDNIPEQLQYADAGSLLQERIDSLEGAISDIENIDLQEFDDWRDENGYGEEDFDSWCEENGLIDEDVDMDDLKEDFETEAEDKYNDYLDDVRSEIEDSLNNIE